MIYDSLVFCIHRFPSVRAGTKEDQTEVTSPEQALEMVRNYHAATKHSLHRLARSLGYLDWATQPDPFRRFESAGLMLFPFMQEDSSPPYDLLFQPDKISPQQVCLRTIGQFFELSMAVSAWKEYMGSRWALRINPSSGNLHPTESYVLLGPPETGGEIPGFGCGARICHYAPREHGLEIRADLASETWRALVDGFPPGAFFVGLSSIFWREAWKYGERAFRYCQHDVGHALAALRLSAAMLGWRLVLLEDMADAEIAALLGLDRADEFHKAEPEYPELLAVVIPSAVEQEIPLALRESAVKETRSRAEWHGRANVLSCDHVAWDAIDVVAAACEKPRTTFGETNLVRESSRSRLGHNPAELRRDPVRISPMNPLREALPARQIITQRRSAVAMDGETSISSEGFYQMLARTLPAGNSCIFVPPWDAVWTTPRVHLCLFVHRVDGLSAGLYVLVRDLSKKRALRDAMKPSFVWEKPENCPSRLPLFNLADGDCTKLAAQVSCWQDIAGDGAFSLGMVAEFDAPLREHGAWCYKRLFWETGMIGQVLYLEAEAAGVRATGIGCFLDDPMHEAFGLSGSSYQSLYHFTVGGPLEDARLTTLPPYSAERGKNEAS